jgi:hypothetical protein
MSNDFELFAEAADNGGDVDADVALIAAFLSRDLSSVQIAAVHDRLENDHAFREKVQPLIEGWTLRGNDDTTAISLARGRAQRTSSLTRAEIDAGWQRHRAAPQPALTLQPNSRHSAARARDNQTRRSTLRVAAMIAVIALPIAVVAQLVVFGARGTVAPDHERTRGEAVREPELQQRQQPAFGSPTEKAEKRSEGRDPKFALLVANLEAVRLNISVTPFVARAVDPGVGLRSAMLYTPSDSRSRLMLIEPHLMRADGSYVSGAARVAKEELLRVLDVLDRGGFLATAETYHSERVPKPQGPPPFSKHINTYLAAGQKVGAELKISFDDAGDYGTTYVILPSWDKQLGPLLTELRGALVDSSAKALLTQLLATANLKGPVNK